jgi:hypothetical protein
LYKKISIAMIALALLLMSGCSGTDIGRNINNTLSTENESVITDTTLSESTGTMDWEPTKYDTVNKLEGVTMAIKDGTVSPTGLTVVFDSKLDNECIYGEYFLLEREVNGEWYGVPVAIEGNYAFKMIGYRLPPGGSSEWSVDWEWLYGILETGKYRIVKDIFRDNDKYYMAAEFSISGENAPEPKGETKRYSYHNLEVELTNVKSDRTETMIDDGGGEWKYTVITCYPGAELTVIKADMSDPAYSADGKAHPDWGILIDPYNSANRIEITDDMQPVKLNSDMRGVYSLESHLYVFRFEIYQE